MESPTENTKTQATADNGQGLPAYAPAGMIQSRLAPVSKATLGNWVIKGWVRSFKVGESQQSARLYSVSDTREALDRLAAGARPRRKKRKTC